MDYNFSKQSPRQIINTVIGMLDSNDDLNIQDEFGVTILQIMTSMSQNPIVKRLVEKGADINIKDNFGTSSLDIALMRGNVGLLKIFRVPLNIDQ